MEVRINNKNNHLVISIIGSVNTDTVKQLREEVEGIDFEPFDSVQLDFKDVNYISSAGLRELLVMQKRYSKGKIQTINVSDDVYEIFNITGFDNILEVVKTDNTKDDYSRYSFKDFLAKKVSLYQDEVILSESNGNITWAQLDKMSDLIAEDLLNLGVKKGSHVGICSSNSSNWIATFFAIQKIGAMAILVNPLLGAGEIQFLSKAGDITHLCLGPCVGIQNDAQEFMAKITDPNDSNIKALYNIVEKVDIEGREVSNLAKAALDSVTVEADDPCVMIFTSGSTGVPKGVLLSSYNLLNAAICGVETLHLKSDDIMCLVLPLFHIFGLAASLLVSMMKNIRIVMPERIKPEPIMDMIEKEKATILLSVPTLILMILSSPEFKQEKIDSLRHIVLGGAPVSEAHMLLMKSKIPNAGFYIVYGLSEMSPVSVTLKDDTIEHVTKSIGLPTDLVQVMIQDVATKEECPVGETGEILVQGPGLMSGYYKTPIEKQDFDEKGWFHTGDLGFLTEDGYLHFAGRKKEIIIRGGENILPGEIAEVVAKLDYVTACQIIGIPDDTWGESIGCALLVKPEHTFNEDEFKDYLKEHLASNKIPTVIKVYDVFPLLANGKVDVLKLKAQMTLGK